jgi:hypothetical protein
MELEQADWVVLPCHWSRSSTHGCAMLPGWYQARVCTRLLRLKCHPTAEICDRHAATRQPGLFAVARWSILRCSCDTDNQLIHLRLQYMRKQAQDYWNSTPLSLDNLKYKVYHIQP